MSNPIYQSLLNSIASYEHATPYNILEDMVKTLGEGAIYAALGKILWGDGDTTLRIGPRVRTGYEEFAERVDAINLALLSELEPKCPLCGTPIKRDMLAEVYVLRCPQCDFQGIIPYSRVPHNENSS